MSRLSTSTGRRNAMLACVAAIVVGVLENSLLGADGGGAKHDISVAFFLVAVVAIVGLLALAAVSVTARVRTR